MENGGIINMNFYSLYLAANNKPPYTSRDSKELKTLRKKGKKKQGISFIKEQF